MSSTSPSTGGNPEEHEPPSARPASPGRYSLSTEGSTPMAAVRIDSTHTAPVGSEAHSSPTVGMQAAPPAPSAYDLLSSRGAESGSAPAPERGAPLAAPPPRHPGSPPRLPLPRKPPATPSRGLPPPATPPAAAAAPLALAPLAAAHPLSSPPPSVEPSSASRPPFPSFDEGSIAFAFDALMSEGTSGLAGRDTVDLAPVRELFAELAANHMRHVRDFMIDVKWGEAPREWVEICIPAVISLRRAAERLELDELAPVLDAFSAQLTRTLLDPARTIDGATKARLLEEYERLVLILPQAFALDRDKSQREAVIIQALCLSVPDVRKVTIDKLHAAGLTSLSMLFEAKADEVAQVAGIPEVLALRIVERFQAYRCELQNVSPQDARAAERERLTALTTQLRDQHDSYEEASRGWSPDDKAKKRDLIRAREETWLAIRLLLARFGEVERIQGIEKVPFSQRIEQLADYLEEARERYRSE